MTNIISENVEKLTGMLGLVDGLGSGEGKMHLIQPVGFSLHNVLCALSHERIESATLLVTEEVPLELVNLAIGIANDEIRDSKLDLEKVTFHTVRSPGSETSAQYESVSGIEVPRGSNPVIGVTGGTQKLVGMLLSRFGSESVLWVEDGPKAVLSVRGVQEKLEIELEEEDFRRLYQGAIDVVGENRSMIRNGRLSITKEVSIPKWNGEPRNPWKDWKKGVRDRMHAVASEINEIEEAMGRLQFRYNLSITHQESSDNAKSRIDSMIGRLPKRVSIRVNGKSFIDGIERISVNSKLTESFIREGVYEWEIGGDSGAGVGSDTLHVIVGKNNSVGVANAISNHRPSRVCIWAISHKEGGAEVQALCNQAFTLFGWLSDDLPRVMGLIGGPPGTDVPKLSPPSPSWVVPDGVFFINTNAGSLSHEVRELASRLPEISGSTIDLSSGSGMISAILHRALVNEFRELGVSHTNHYTGTVSNLNNGEIKTGQGIGINDRLWLSQRPVRNFSRPEGMGLGLLREIGERSRKLARDRGYNHCILPNRSWGGVIFEKEGNDAVFSMGGERIEFHHPVPNAGFWLDRFVMESLPHHFSLLDCIGSVELFTRDPVERKKVDDQGRKVPIPKNDVEIDVIFMQEDGMGVVSCKAVKDWANDGFISELQSYKVSVGGPRCKAIICHLELGRGGLRSRLPTGVGSLCWPETVGVSCELDTEEG